MPLHDRLKASDGLADLSTGIPMSAFARVLFFAAVSLAWGDTPAVTLEFHLEANGQINGTLSSRREELQLAPVMPAVMHCKAKAASVDDAFGDYRCSNGLRRDGLSLDAVFDLAPIVRKLDATDEIQLWLNYPRLGFETSSVPLKDRGALWRVSRSASFTASEAPGSIRVQFGYHSDQLAAIYLPLAVLALALILIARSLCTAGLEHLNRSVFLLGTIFWLGLASWLQAGAPLRIVLSGTPLANIAAAILEYCTPLLCVAAGVALGAGNRTDRSPSERFAEVFWTYGMLLFPLTIALTVVPSMADGDWIGAAPWLAAVPVSIIVCRWRIRKRGGSSVRQLAGGELKDRVSELAARAGRRSVEVYVSSSTRSQASNAFALLRNGVVLTAPLIKSLNRRQVDAVVAHELSHFGHSRRSPWAALAVAAVLFQTPLTDILLPTLGGLLVAGLLPLIVYFMALRGARKREFAADAGSVALTGDPRALISGLAKIARDNKQPLEVNAAVEWFSTHPSTDKRIRALAAAARLGTAEIETLCSHDDPGESYTLPPDDSRAIFTLAWQKANGTRYSWAALLGASGAGLSVAWLLERFAGAGVPQFLLGIVLACGMTKLLSATVLSMNYARLRRKLARKLGVSGQLVGLAVGPEPRVYNGFRFSDVGFVWFEGGRLCYRSERTTIALNPADVVEVTTSPAAPSSWRRLQPMVRFRHPESGDVKAFILHPVEWGATPRRLFRSVEQWRTTAVSAERTSITGLVEIAGEPFRVPTTAVTARGFRIPGSITLVGVMVTGWWLQPESWPAWYALALTACAYIFMFLPAMTYRPPYGTLAPASSR